MYLQYRILSKPVLKKPLLKKKTDGAIDISTYGLEEGDEDDDPRNWKKATEAL